MRAETQWWIDAGNRDIEMAEKLLEDGFYEGCAFHAQQSAEKWLKALLLEHGYTLRTHSNVELLDMVGKHLLPVTPDLQNCARRLDAHYINSRYPNGVGGSPEKFYDKIIAEEAIQCARKLMEFSRSKIT